MVGNRVVLAVALIALGIASTTVTVLGQTVNPALPCTNETRANNCTLPACRCSGPDIPGNLSEAVIPQLVFLTFDDAVSIDNFAFYEEVLSNRKNPNGHPITVSFFITHEYTNYSMVHQLWRNGHDISLHSMTHKSDVSYWANLNTSMWQQEVRDQRDQMSTFARVRASDIKGVRAPFLQGGGDTMYGVLSNAKFQYECSRPTLNNRMPGMWPYTNDFASSQDCQIPPCPVGSYPGFWTIPMIDFIGGDGEGCAMVDACKPVPETADQTFELLKRNFEDHYKGNRAPYGIYAHSAWMNGTEDEFIWERREGYVKFLDYLATLNDTYIVSISRGISWIQQPTTLANLDSFAPFKVTVQPDRCPRNYRCQYSPEQTPFPTERWLNSCVPCPNVYPWLGNPLGR